MKKLPFLLFACILFFGCGNKSKPGDARNSGSAPAAKLYALEDVQQQLNESNVTLNGTHDDVKSFFQAHPEYQLCRDDDAFSVGVVRNKKNDPKADDIYILANYRDGKISGMEVGPPQFSVNNLPSYCK